MFIFRKEISTNKDNYNELFVYSKANNNEIECLGSDSLFLPFSIF